MAREHPEVSIIIPVFNQEGYVVSCLRSICRSKCSIAYEILVIDDGSTEEARHALFNLSGVSVLRNFKNLGYLASCNRGAINAKGKYLLFLNSDTEVTDRWLDEMVGTYERFSDTGIVGPKLLNPDHSLQECGGVVWRDGSGCNFGRGDDPQKSEYCFTRKTDYVSGACLLISKQFFLELGLFDRRYAPAYYEDTDLAFAAREKGREVYVEPKAVVIHHEGKSNGTSLDRGVKRYQTINQATFRDKWREVLQCHELAGHNMFRARDRSQARLKLLVIDQYVPRFDRDAGSRCMNTYLRHLVELGASITFLPDNFYRDPVYVPPLERMGIEVLYGPDYYRNHRDWLVERLPDFDVVLLSRPHISIKYVDLVKKHCPGRVIYLGHDIYHLRLSLEQKFSVRTSDSEVERAREQEYALWGKCDVLMYPSAEEVDYIRARIPAAQVFEVPIYSFDPCPPRKRSPIEDTSGFLFVANFNHPPNRDAIHWFRESVYPQIATHLGEPILRIIGSDIPRDIADLASPFVEIRSNVSDEDLAFEYCRARVAVVPLRYGAGVKGKTLEAMNFGVPLVTTRFGAQGVPGIEACALVAEDAGGFAEACVALYTDPALWERFSNAARKTLLSKYSSKQTRAALGGLLRGSLARHAMPQTRSRH